MKKYLLLLFVIISFQMFSDTSLKKIPYSKIFNKIKKISKKAQDYAQDFGIMEKSRNIFIATDSENTFLTGHTYSNTNLKQIKKAFKDIGYNLKYIHSSKNLHDFRYLICINNPDNIEEILKKCPKRKLILFLFDSPVKNPEIWKKKFYSNFSKVYSWDDSLVKKKKFEKFYIPQNHLKMITPEVSFYQKKFLSIFSSNEVSDNSNELYSERKSLIHFYEKYYPNDLDLFGYGWNSLEYKTTKGYVSDKIGHLREYKFTICYEDMKGLRGYITNQIFDAFISGSVPVYYGAKNIDKYIPKGCYILRADFANNRDLYNHLKNIPFYEYENYLQNIRKFLVSNKIYPFTMDHFIKTFKIACNIQNG